MFVVGRKETRDGVDLDLMFLLTWSAWMVKERTVMVSQANIAVQNPNNGPEVCSPLQNSYRLVTVALTFETEENKEQLMYPTEMIICLLGFLRLKPEVHRESLRLFQDTFLGIGQSYSTTQAVQMCNSCFAWSSFFFHKKYISHQDIQTGRPRVHM